MTRKTRNLIISIAVTAVLAGAVLWVKRPKTDTVVPEPQPEQEKPVTLVDFEPGSLRILTIENPDGELSISSMNGQTWLVKDAPEGYRFKDTLLRSLVSNLSSMQGLVVDENPADPGLFGLDTPKAKVTIADNAGNQSVVLFGAGNPSGQGRYASLPGDSRVFLVQAVRANKAFWSISQLREDRLPELNFEAVTSILIKNGDSVFRTEPHTGDLGPYRPLASFMDVVEPWKGRYLFEDHVFQETIAATPPPDRISAFPDELPSNPGALGLGPEADRIRIETADGGYYNLEIGGSDGGGRRYARESSYGDVIFLMDESELGLLNLDPYKHTNQFVFLAGIAVVREIRIEGIGPDRLLSIEKLGDPDDDSDDIFHIDGIEIGEKDFKKAYQAVIGLLYEGVARDDDIGNDPELTIHYYHVDPEVPSKTVVFRPYDQTYYVAGVKGEESEFLIGRYQIDRMLQSLDAAIGDGP
jgi:hypothetical protein